MNTNCLRPSLRGVLLLLFIAISSPAQEAQPSAIVETDVKIPMRDGTKLAANIFRPKGEGRFPVILMRTPYGKPDEKTGDAKRYTAAGYVMVVQDCRGRGKSEGVWDPFRYDVEDGFDTQEWIGHQAWCNGSIGTAGGSYVGWTQWAPAPKGSRYLKAMVPVVPFGNAYDLAYTGGAFQLALLMGWGTAVGGVALARTNSRKPSAICRCAPSASSSRRKSPISMSGSNTTPTMITGNSAASITGMPMSPSRCSTSAAGMTSSPKSPSTW